MNSVIKENFTSGKIYKALCYAELITRVENIAKEAGYSVSMSFNRSKNSTVQIFMENKNENLDMIHLRFSYYKYDYYYIYILEGSSVG